MARRRRLLSLAANLGPSQSQQQRRAAEAGLGLAVRLGLPPGQLLARLLDARRGEAFYQVLPLGLAARCPGTLILMRDWGFVLQGGNVLGAADWCCLCILPLEH
jgi:hypothetical protein